jgi:hypothetical protein
MGIELSPDVSTCAARQEEEAELCTIIEHSNVVCKGGLQPRIAVWPRGACGPADQAATVRKPLLSLRQLDLMYRELLSVPSVVPGADWEAMQRMRW